MVLLVTVRVPEFDTPPTVSGIPRDRAIGHGEGAELHTAAVTAEFPEMVLLVTVRVPKLSHRRRRRRISRDGAIGDGEGAEFATAAAVEAEFPEMVLLVMVRVPEFGTPPPSLMTLRRYSPRWCYWSR